ncbi:hypothetical protein BX616_008432, partial [Lobosporangium transversale]
TLGRVDGPLLGLFSPGLELISSVGAGYDFVDVVVATRNKQWVTNTPGVVDDATADATILLMLSTLRRYYEIEYAMRNGLTPTQKPRIGRDPTNMTLGIVGLGGIGKAVAKRALSLGMKVIYYNRRPISIPSSPSENTTEKEYSFLRDVEYVASLDQLLQTADVVSIHVPLSPETHHLFGKDQFLKMKQGSYLINTSRGPVVDEEALVQALESGHLAGAGLDVYENEPKVHPKLLKNMNVALMPHLGAFTIETITKMETLSMKNIDLYFSTGSLLTPVNNFNKKGTLP